MAVSATKAHVIITADSKSARNAIDQMKASLANLEKEIKKVPEGSTKWKSLNTRIANLKSGIEQSEREFASLSSVLNNLSGSSFRQLQRAYTQITQQIKSHSRATEQDRAELSRMIADQKRLEKEMHKVSGMWKTQEGAINSVIKRLSAYVAVYGGFNMIMGKVTEMTKKNLEFADTISDIQKVSGLSQHEVEKLTDDIAKIDSRNSQQELDRLAYAAGKLGIGTREGANGLLEFTKAADQLQVALKEYLGEDGVVSLMKVADVMGDTKKYGVEQALLKNGSALNFMTQSTSATADYMVDFISRTGGMAKASNITTPQLIGLASTLDSLGQNVEVSGTSMNKFFAQLMTHYSAVSDAVGLNKEWVKSTLEQGQTMEVVMSIFDKLGTKGGLSALGPLFKDLGSDGARLMQVMTQLANNSDRVRTYVDMSNKAFEEGTSVTNEYNIKNQNAAAIMQRMANSWDKMFVNANNTGVLKSIAQDLLDLSKALQNNNFWVTSLSISFKALMLALRGLIALLPAIINGFAAFKVAQLVTWFLKLIPAIEGSAKALRILKLAGGWITAAVAIVTALGLAIAHISEEANKASKHVDTLGKTLRESMRNSNAEILKAKKNVDELFASLNKENLTQNERKNIIAQINTQYKDYLPKLLTEKSSAQEIAKAWASVNKQLTNNIRLKAKQEDLENIAEKYSRREGDALEELGNTLDNRVGNSQSRGKGNRSVDIQQKIQSSVDSLVEEAKNNKAGGNAKTITDKVVKQMQSKIQGNVSDNDYKRIMAGQTTRDAYITAQLGYIDEMDYKAAADKGIKRGELQKKVREQAKKDYDELTNIRKQIYNYATAQVMEYNDTNRTNKYWNRIIPKGATATGTEDTGTDTSNTVITEDTAKEDAKAARTAAAAERKELREMRKEAQEELKGIKSIIDAFYQQREAEIQADFESGLITEVQRTELLSETAMQKAKTMIDAWNVMLKKPGSDKVWAERLKAMEGQIYGGSQEMEETLEDISKRNLRKTGDLLRNFGTSMTDGLKRTVAQNENILAQHLSKAREIINKALLQYDHEYKALEKAQKMLAESGLVEVNHDNVGKARYTSQEEKDLSVVTSMAAKGKEMESISKSVTDKEGKIDGKALIAQYTALLATIEDLDKASYTRQQNETEAAYAKRIQTLFNYHKIITDTYNKESAQLASQYNAKVNVSTEDVGAGKTYATKEEKQNDVNEQMVKQHDIVMKLDLKADTFVADYQKILSQIESLDASTYTKMTGESDDAFNARIRNLYQYQVAFGNAMKKISGNTSMVGRNAMDIPAQRASVTTSKQLFNVNNDNVGKKNDYKTREDKVLAATEKLALGGTEFVKLKLDSKDFEKDYVKILSQIKELDKSTYTQGKDESKEAFRTRLQDLYQYQKQAIAANNTFMSQMKVEKGDSSASKIEERKSSISSAAVSQAGDVEALLARSKNPAGEFDYSAFVREYQKMLSQIEGLDKDSYTRRDKESEISFRNRLYMLAQYQVQYAETMKQMNGTQTSTINYTAKESEKGKPIVTSAANIEGQGTHYESQDEKQRAVAKGFADTYNQTFTITLNSADFVKEYVALLQQIKDLDASTYTQMEGETDDMYKKRLQALFNYHQEVGEDYEQAQAESRKEFVTSAKLAYKKTGREEADKDNIEQAQMGVDTNSKLGTLGLDSTLAADDMEIKLYEAKLEAAANYYDFLKERGADEVTLREQEMAVEQAAMDLADQMIQKSTDRLSALKDMGTAIETFGEEFGEALDGSLEDRQEAAKNLLKSLGNITKKMIVEWVKQRIQKSINDKLMQKQEKAHQAFELNTVTETSTKKQVIKQVEGTALSGIQTTTNTTLETEQKAHDAKDVAQEGTTTVAKTSLNLAQAIAKCFSSLGPVGGAVAAATVSAAIGAVLAWALSKIGGSADTPDSATASTTKLASGMLTYDKGNVQMFRTLDNGDMATVTGTDGQSYNARVQSSLDTGVVSSPVATLINGQPSIVGEKGSEMVIGRQTFAAMRSLRPDLVQQIVRFDKNRSGARFRTYDDGNVSELGDAGSSALGLGAGTQDNAQMMALITSNRDTNVALTSAITSLNAQLAAGIGVRKYGSGGVVEEVADGFNFLKGKSSNKNIKRLFG